MFDLGFRIELVLYYRGLLLHLKYVKFSYSNIFFYVCSILEDVFICNIF